jgi:hypothetical protein
MVQELRLSLSEANYQALLRVALMAGLSPEEWATDYLIQEVHSIDEDPLLRLAGTLSSDVTDLTERHDEYLGESILERASGRMND